MKLAVAPLSPKADAGVSIALDMRPLRHRARLCAIVALAATATLLAVAAIARAERRALLVGIDDYGASRPSSRDGASHDDASGARPADRGWRNLAGAANDGRAMRDLLVHRYGFAADQVELLLDQRATRAAILAALDRLIARSGPGDVLVFHFSGHGSQVVNSRSDEADKRDETLVPADVRRGARDIRDKELRRRLFKALERGAHPTVILDTCHSGSGGRGFPSVRRVRRILLDRRDAADGSAAGPHPEDRGAVVLSAAQDDELATEARDERGNHHGAFTLALLQAMRAAGAYESAEEVFLRAQARLRAVGRAQRPVLAGSPAAIRRPLFGGRTDRRDGRTVVAVEEALADGTVVLAGGLAHGLTVGSELQLVATGQSEPASRSVRLRVRTVDSMTRSTAEVIAGDAGAAPARSRRRLGTGDLLYLVGWASPPTAPLRVWISRTGRGWAAAVEQLGAVQTEWVEDPTETAPTHTLSWHEGGLRLTGRDGWATRLGAELDPSELSRQLGAGSRLFVQHPAPPGLITSFVAGLESDHDALEETADGADADYLLVVRRRQDATDGKAEVAWVRPSVATGDRVALPVRTDWYPLRAGGRGGAATASELRRAALRLAKLKAWLTLESPPDDDYPYRLLVRRGDEPLLDETDLRLRAGDIYSLVLRAREWPLSRPAGSRFIYVFSIDSRGASTLLFPRPAQGSVENRLPASARDIALGPGVQFEVTPPFGRETLFLITTAQPIPNPAVLAFPGVRHRAVHGETPLEELLAMTGASRRALSPITSQSWSIERLTVETVPH